MKFRNHALVPLTLGLLFASSSCLATQNGIEPLLQLPRGQNARTVVTTLQPSVQEPVLYARDGSVVAGRQAGVVSQVTTTGRTVEGGEGSRMYLLELYQKAVDERDKLELEVEALQAEFKRMSQELEGREDELDAALATIDERDERVVELENQTLELGQRLATAHLARLEAEKELLEDLLAESDDMLSTEP